MIVNAFIVLYSLYIYNNRIKEITNQIKTKESKIEQLFTLKKFEILEFIILYN